MPRHPSESFRDPVVLGLIDRLEKTSSPHEYMGMLTAFHRNMLNEGVKTAQPSTISDFVLFECFWGLDLNPDSLISRYKELFPNGEDLGHMVSEYEATSPGSTELQVSDFGRKLNQAWNEFGSHGFMKCFKNYHWHLWREGIAEVDLGILLGVILFEKSVGFPLDHQEVVKAYKKVQYGFVRERIEGDNRLSEEVEIFRMDSKPSGRVAMTIEPDWENYWKGFDGLSFLELKQKGLLPLYWYVHDAEETFGASYKGVALIENGKVLYYDRCPMGGGPFKTSDFKNPSFRRKSEIVAEHVERALEKVNYQHQNGLPERSTSYS